MIYRLITRKSVARGSAWATCYQTVDTVLQWYSGAGSLVLISLLTRNYSPPLHQNFCRMGRENKLTNVMGQSRCHCRTYGPALEVNWSIFGGRTYASTEPTSDSCVRRRHSGAILRHFYLLLLTELR